MGAFFWSSFWCLFAYGLAGLGCPLVWIAFLSFVIYRREKNREKAMSASEIQIDSDHQVRAIGELVALMPRHDDLLEWDCSYCGRRNKLKDTPVGAAVKCSHCGARVKLKALYDYE
jgi:DNA-directed RNA polymerase subunit RPC12/RpoP